MTAPRPTFDRALDLLATVYDDPARAPQTHKLALMALLEGDGPQTRREVQRYIGRSTRQTRRVLNELEGHGLIEREALGRGTGEPDRFAVVEGVEA